MQLRYDTQLNVEEYISTKAWQKATLTVCPNHPKGGCSLARHGTYVRKCGNGQIAHIARWYCAESHTTFSLLPDCFGARMPGTLQQLEVQIFDLAGRLVADVAGTGTQSGVFEHQWDGRDAGGEVVAPGIYVYKISLDTDQGSQAASGLVAVAY